MRRPAESVMTVYCDVGNPVTLLIPISWRASTIRAKYPLGCGTGATDPAPRISPATPPGSEKTLFPADSRPPTVCRRIVCLNPAAVMSIASVRDSVAAAPVVAPRIIPPITAPAASPERRSTGSRGGDLNPWALVPATTASGSWTGPPGASGTTSLPSPRGSH